MDNPYRQSFNNLTLFAKNSNPSKIKKLKWKHKNKTYIFYITAQEQKFFITNYKKDKNNKIMYFYLYLKHLTQKNKTIYISESDLNLNTFNYSLHNTKKYLIYPLKTANLINAQYNLKINKWEISINEESTFNMFSTDLSITNYIKANYKNYAFITPNGYHYFINYHNGILTFKNSKSSHCYTLKQICQKNIDKTPSPKLISFLSLALDDKKIKIDYSA